MGRPVLLTPAIAASIIDAKSRGLTHAQAAEAAGIGSFALRHWLHRGASGEEPYASLRAAVAAAEESWRRHQVAELAQQMRASVAALAVE